jgi:hypothetical protein
MSWLRKGMLTVLAVMAMVKAIACQVMVVD